MNTVIRRCGQVTKVKDISTRVVLKENPNQLLKLVEASSSSLSATEPMNTTLRVRGGSPAPNLSKQEWGGSLASDGGADNSAPNTAEGSTQWVSKSTSPYAQGCDDIDQQFNATAVECKLCGANNDVRMSYGHAGMSCFGAPFDDKEGSKRLTADVSRHFGFTGKFTTRGFLSKAWHETKRALKHGNVARPSGFPCVIDRSTRDDIYRSWQHILRSV